MNKKKWIVMLSVVLSACMLLTACSRVRRKRSDSEAGQNTMLRSMTTTTMFSNEDQPQSVVTMEYDENGLITRVSGTANGEEQSMPIEYRFDMNGNPVGFSMEMDGQAISVGIENRYENGGIVEAVITSITTDGEEMLSGDVSSDRTAEAARASAAAYALQMIQRFTGYRNCTLRVKNTDDEIRNENGMTVFSYTSYGTGAQSTEAAYGADGSIRSVSSVYDLSDGKKELMSSTGILTDADLYQREISMYIPMYEGTATITIRYEDGTDPDTGARIRIGKVGSIDMPEDMREAAGSQLDMIRNMPVFRVTLDDRGRIVKTETADEYALMLGGSKTILIFDEMRRPIRQETQVPMSGRTYQSIVEYVYR